ncbi:OmpA/MotB family protein [Halomonas sp. 328]|uniref:OmpA/MotB family protein n=1 Tax=Halomonas sp. 328 TaxID=2776704 RepID=UPI0018A7104D|nr:flagellar motor protein MotB [Halomonas sp. 328]MBF8222275.1 flagellar motor protein MotB [Halomonas sp. 328]
MPASHRDRHRHDSLFEELEPDEGQAGWMLSYIDMMTLLVALFALLLSLAAVFRGPAEASPGASDAPRAELSFFALAAALEVAAGPRVPASPGPRGRDPLDLPQPIDWAPPRPAAPAPTLAVRRVPFASPASRPAPLPELPEIALHDRLDPEAWDDLTLVVTERPPSNAHRLDPEALAGAERLQEEVSARLDEARELPSLEGVEISPVAEGLNLRIQDRLLFDSATAELSEAGRELIERLVAIIQRHEGTVSVEGHSDDRPIFTDRFPSNWELSSARAIVILRQLERAGVDASRLRAIGYGETRPLADNDSPEGRAANRRVEVIVHL